MKLSLLFLSFIFASLILSTPFEPKLGLAVNDFCLDDNCVSNDECPVAKAKVTCKQGYILHKSLKDQSLVCSIMMVGGVACGSDHGCVCGEDVSTATLFKNTKREVKTVCGSSQYCINVKGDYFCQDAVKVVKGGELCAREDGCYCRSERSIDRLVNPEEVKKQIHFWFKRDILVSEAVLCKQNEYCVGALGHGECHAKVVRMAEAVSKVDVTDPRGQAFPVFKDQNPGTYMDVKDCFYGQYAVKEAGQDWICHNPEEGMAIIGHNDICFMLGAMAGCSCSDYKAKTIASPAICNAGEVCQITENGESSCQKGMQVGYLCDVGSECTCGDDERDLIKKQYCVLGDDNKFSDYEPSYPFATLTPSTVAMQIALRKYLNDRKRNIRELAGVQEGNKNKEDNFNEFKIVV